MKPVKVGIEGFLHDGNLLNGKNQVADDAVILKKIGSWIINFRIIIVECFEWLGQKSVSFLYQG